MLHASRSTVTWRLILIPIEHFSEGKIFRVVQTKHELRKYLVRNSPTPPDFAIYFKEQIHVLRGAADLNTFAQNVIVKIMVRRVVPVVAQSEGIDTKILKKVVTKGGKLI